jgi:hypothetical protein
MESRNQREGRYIGKVGRRYQRIPGAKYLGFSLPCVIDNCEDCGDCGAALSIEKYVTYSGKFYHQEYGTQHVAAGITVCLSCGARHGWEDSSI